MRPFLLSAPFLIVIAAGVLAQSSPPGFTTVLAPFPPAASPLDERVSSYLRTAQTALAAKRYYEAQEALEMAQTRMLDRSVLIGQTNKPSDNPGVGQISQALQALAARDNVTSMRLIQTAIVSATARGL